MGAFDKVVVVAALLLISISLLNPGGLVVGLTLGALLLVGAYGGKYLMRLEQSRRMGEKSNPTVRERIAGDDSNSEGGWRR